MKVTCIAPLVGERITTDETYLNSYVRYSATDWRFASGNVVRDCFIEELETAYQQLKHTPPRS